MAKINQNITGSNNIQVAGDFIKTEKVVKKIQVIHSPDEHITDAQAKEVKDRIQKIAESRSKESRYSFAQAYNALYEKYHITSYKLLPREKYEEAIKWLDKQIAIYRPELKKVDTEQYRKDMYKSLNARANQLRIDIHEFANRVLMPKKPITSLKELSDTRLQKLYNNLYRIKHK